MTFDLYRIYLCVCAVRQMKVDVFVVKTFAGGKSAKALFEFIC